MTESPVNMTALEARLRANDAAQVKVEIKQVLDLALTATKRQLNTGCRPEQYQQLTKELAAIEAANLVISAI